MNRHFLPLFLLVSMNLIAMRYAEQPPIILLSNCLSSEKFEFEDCSYFIKNLTVNRLRQGRATSSFFGQKTTFTSGACQKNCGSYWDRLGTQHMGWFNAK